MAGRRPKPTRLKLLQGTTRADRVRHGEPEPPEGAIVRPAFLKGDEIGLWDEFESTVIAMGTLTVADTRTFANWCVMQAQFEEEKRLMNASAITQLRGYAASLGLDATARARLGYANKKKKDPADAFFKVGGK